MQSYQGYPYTAPPVTVAPSIDEATASKWIHLPRRQIVPELPGREMQIKQEDRPVVYIEVPEPEENQVPCRPVTPDIDVEDYVQKHTKQDRPVVYIDVPEPLENRVPCRPIIPDTDVENVEQTTIYYDPFDDRRIDSTEDFERIESEGSPELQGPSRPYRPTPGSSRFPPDNLNLRPGASQFNLPSIETHLYGQSDGFDLSPLSLDQPAPPPAYSEAVINCGHQANQTRTEVIINTTQLDNLNNPHRKYLYCYRCTKQVHTVTALSSGWFTYTLCTLFLLCCFLPCVAMVCIMKKFKQRDHYCPNCSGKICYEIPLLCNKMIFVNRLDDYRRRN